MIDFVEITEAVPWTAIAPVRSFALRDLPSGTVTLLFTDIEGSTRLLRELGERYANVLAEHRGVLREAFSRHGGIEVDTQGDAFFVAFARASEAVLAAGEIQNALGDGPVRARIGIHTGEPVVTEEGYVGIDVHRAARIMGAGHGGQVLLSGTTARLLDSTVELLDLGDYRLKDLSAPQRLYQLGNKAFAPPRTLYQTNLPMQATPLVGREHELEEAGALLRSHRLLTLTGPPGAGKTRLAIGVAAELLEDFPGGVIFVRLDATSDPALIPSAIAASSGTKEEAGEPLVRALCRSLAFRGPLLLLDNFEHVLEAAPVVDELTSAGVTVLATSRTPLRLSSEREYSVPPLAEDSAVTLFIERARAIDPAFEPDDTVRAICEQLDRLPLAIELAAGRTRLFTPKALLRRLDECLGILLAGPRDLPERQRTLRGAIDWSYQLLEERGKTALARLGVFHGFTVEAAEVVSGVGLETLASLIEASLVQRQGDVQGERRFRLLETIREFAGERLHESGDAERLSQEHAYWCLALVEEETAKIDGPSERAALARLDAENGNLRAALVWQLSHGDVEATFRLATALGRYWEYGNHFTEGRDWLERVLTATPDLRTPARARVEVAAASLTFKQGDDRSAQPRFEHALAILQAADDGRGRALCHWGLGWIHYNRDEFDAAARIAEQGLHLAERAAPDLIPKFARILGGIAADRGDVASARRRGQQGLATARSLGMTAQVALQLSDLSRLARREDNLTEARKLSQEALAVARSFGDSFLTAFVLLRSAETERHAGNLSAAEAHAQEALTVFRELGMRPNAGAALYTLGVVANTRGEGRKALEILGESWELIRESVDRVGPVVHLERVAELASRSGAYGVAARLLGQAASMRNDLGIPVAQFERARLEQASSEARAKLGDEGFDLAWEEGSRSDADETLAAAFEELDRLLAGPGPG